MIAQGEPEGLVVTYSSSVKMSETCACGQDDSYFMLVLRPSLLPFQNPFLFHHLYFQVRLAIEKTPRSKRANSCIALNCESKWKCPRFGFVNSMSSLWATKEINEDFDREAIVRTTVSWKAQQRALKNWQKKTKTLEERLSSAPPYIEQPSIADDKGSPPKLTNKQTNEDINRDPIACNTVSC